MTSETFRVLKRGFEPKNDPDSIQPSIEFNGVNLLKLHASDSPHQFGRNLSQAMFGVNYLTDFVISPRRRGSREPISKDALSIFKSIRFVCYSIRFVCFMVNFFSNCCRNGLDKIP